MNKYSVFCEQNVNLSALVVRVLRFCSFTIQQAHPFNYGGNACFLFALLVERLVLYEHIHDQRKCNDRNGDGGVDYRRVIGIAHGDRLLRPLRQLEGRRGYGIGAARGRGGRGLGGHDGV